MLIKIVNDELVRVMGEANEGLNLAAQPPAVVLMAGLQGSGKTTSVAKLARWLKEREKKKVMVVSCDVYRPAAIDQLETLAGEVGRGFLPVEPDQKPLDIAAARLRQARKAVRRRADRRYRRPPARRRADDGGDQGAACRTRTRWRPCSWSTP